MSAQSNPIYIDNFQRGLGSSPYVGFGKMVGLDIFRRPGIIQLGTRLINTNQSISGFPTAQVIDASGNIYVGTSTGNLYKNGTLIQTGLVSVHDLVVIQNCLLIFKSGTTIDLLTNLNGGTTYVGNWKTGLEQSIFGWKKALLGQDNVVYFGNETKLGSLTSFTPTPAVNPTTATANINLSCLSTGLPNDRIVKTITENNRYICISTSFVGNGFGNTKLYFMDRGTLDPSRTSFFLSIGVEIPERTVTQMIVQNNRLLFLGNDTGTIYTSNTTSYSIVAVVPNRLQGQNYNYISPSTPNAVALLNSEVLWGIGGENNSAYDVVYGVYSLRGNALICKQTFSSNEYGQTASVNVGAMCVISPNQYRVGWQTGSTVGIDEANVSIGTGFNCWFETPFYETGTSIRPRTFQTIQFNTGNVLVSGQAMKVYYRVGSNQTWVEYATYSYSGSTLTITYAGDGSTTNQNGVTNSFNSKFPVTATTNIQLKVAFDTGNATYGTNIELQSIILI